MIGDLIESFKNRLDDNISKSIKENDKKLSEISLNIEVIEEITSHINNDTQIILKEIIHDLISGLYSGLQALYRNAYISLRSGIELSLTYVYFLDHKLELIFQNNTGCPLPLDRGKAIRYCSFLQLMTL